MKVLISGGCKNGKSAFAEKLVTSMRTPHSNLYYVATMIPADKEDEARIERHQSERAGYGFETVEAGKNILGALSKCDLGGIFLLDSVTALLANEMFSPDGSIVMDASEKVSADLLQLASMVAGIVFVSDYIYSDAFIYDDLVEVYRSGLAYIDRQLARVCDEVYEACGGVYIAHKRAPRAS